jgi:hypothetical protein
VWRKTPAGDEKTKWTRNQEWRLVSPPQLETRRRPRQPR